VGAIWPVTLQEGRVGLRPIRLRDAAAWREVRTRNGEWLRPWEATTPPESGDVPPSFAAMVRRLRLEARERRTLPWILTIDGRLAGQLTVGGITWGSLRAAYIGYWIDQRYAGSGFTPTAVAMATDYCFETLGLHRIEINVRPENHASRRVPEKLGFRVEGLRPRYLHIDGDWRDHLTYALLAEESGQGVLWRWRQAASPVDRV
jgi:ribosomal-protein-alanine N-acetyltransferase